MKFAERYLEESADFLVVNGDSFMEIDSLSSFAFTGNTEASFNGGTQSPRRGAIRHRSVDA